MKKAKMNNILLFIGLIFLYGCVTIYPTTSLIRATNRMNLMKLSIGMTKQEVLNVMGQDKITTDAFDFNVITNPYRNEILQGENKTFEVLYYYTDRKKADGAITDDELTPLVFDNNKIIGWGWDFINTNIKKYELRIR